MFVAEDGTGLIDANSYCTVSFANDYFTERGNLTWDDAFTDAKEVALIKATDYIELRFANKFKDSTLFPDTPQALSFPRTGKIAIPVQLLRATCEYALRALSAELTADISNDLVVDTTTERVIGPIKTVDSISHAGNDVQYKKTFNRYPAADSLIKQLLKISSGGVVRT
jgi:hypothetical protein